MEVPSAYVPGGASPDQVAKPEELREQPGAAARESLVDEQPLILEVQAPATEEVTTEMLRQLLVPENEAMPSFVAPVVNGEETPRWGDSEGDLENHSD